VNPFPGVRALPIRMSICEAGAKIVASTPIGRAAASATESACWRPRVLGATLSRMKETAIMVRPGYSRRSQVWPKCSKKSSAVITVATTSSRTRSSSEVFT